MGLEEEVDNNNSAIETDNNADNDNDNEYNDSKMIG